MPRNGFIHDKLDIKFLVLYLMARTAAPISLDTLTGLALCDEGVDYFLFAQSVSELLESGHLALEQERYTITEKGRKNGAVWEESLPVSVRRKCDQNLSALNARLRRDAQVRAETLPREEGGFTVRLALDDDHGALMQLECFAASQEQASRLSRGFLARPELVYNAILSTLLADGPEEA